MPQPSLHLALAETVLQDWRSQPARAPFPPANPRCRTAFLHGAIGPDMGFFPGVPRLISELAHHSRTGELPQALLAHARSEVETAYALGWASHILIDAIMHPIINQTADDLVRTRHGVARADRERMHICLETGLDLLMHGRERLLRQIRLDPLFAGDGIAFIERSYRQVHGIALLPAVLINAHRRVALLAGPLLRLQATLAGLPSSLGSRFGLPAAMIARIDAARSFFHTEFTRHSAHALVTFPNFNLETGEEIESRAVAVA